MVTTNETKPTRFRTIKQSVPSNTPARAHRLRPSGDPGRRRGAAPAPGGLSCVGVERAGQVAASLPPRHARPGLGWFGCTPPWALGVYGSRPLTFQPKSALRPHPLRPIKKNPRKISEPKTAPPSYFRRDPPENSQDKKGVSLCRGWHTARWFPPACMWYGL